MHPAKKPANAKSDDRGGVGLCLDRPPQPLVKRTSGVSCRVRGLAKHVLPGAKSLVYLSLGLRRGVVRSAAELFLHFAANVADRSFDPIFIHVIVLRERAAEPLSLRLLRARIQVGIVPSVGATARRCLFILGRLY